MQSKVTHCGMRDQNLKYRYQSRCHGYMNKGNIKSSLSRWGNNLIMKTCNKNCEVWYKFYRFLKKRKHIWSSIQNVVLMFKYTLQTLSFIILFCLCLLLTAYYLLSYKQSPNNNQSFVFWWMIPKAFWQVHVKPVCLLFHCLFLFFIKHEQLKF